MFERTCSADRVAAYIAWAVTTAMFGIAGALLIHQSWFWGLFVAEVACGLSALAAVAHIRVYAIRCCELIRACSDGDPSPLERIPLQRVH